MIKRKPCTRWCFPGLPPILVEFALNSTLIFQQWGTISYNENRMGCISYTQHEIFSQVVGMDTAWVLCAFALPLPTSQGWISGLVHDTHPIPRVSPVFKVHFSLSKRWFKARIGFAIFISDPCKVMQIMQGSKTMLEVLLSTDIKYFQSVGRGPVPWGCSKNPNYGIKNTISHL